MSIQSTSVGSTSPHFAPELAIKAQAKQALQAAADNSITIFSEFGVSVVLTYALSTSGVNLSLDLDTHFGDVSLGNVTLNASNPSATLGGHIGGFEAEIEVSLDLTAKTLTVSGTIKIPIIGDKKFKKTISL